MGYPTGRTRTLTLTGTFSAAMTYSWDGEFVGSEGYNTNFIISVDAWCRAELPAIRDFGFTIASNLSSYATGHHLDGSEITYDARMGSFGDGSPGTIAVGSIPYEAWDPEHTSGGLTVSGSYTFSVRVAEYFDFPDITDIVSTDYLDDTETFPKWGDSSDVAYRGMPARAIRYYEYVEEGSPTSLTISASGINVSLTSEVVSPFELARGHILSASAEGLALRTSLPAGSASVTATEGTEPQTYNWEANYTSGGMSNHADTFSGAACSYSGQRSGYLVDSVQNYVSVTRLFTGLHKYRWNLRGYRYDQVMDQELVWKIFDEDESTPSVELPVTGSATRSVTQYKEHIIAALGGSVVDPDPGATFTEEVNTLSYCNARIKQSSLVAIGESSENWRPFIHGKPFNAFQLSQAAFKVVTDSDDSGWTGVGDTLISSGVRISSPSTGPGSAIRSWTSPGFNFEGYRWLKVLVRSVGSDSETFTLELGSKTWDLHTEADGVWTEQYVDLCCPGNSTWITDSLSTRYPIDLSSGIPISTTDAWGVVTVETLTISNLAADRVIEIAEIALVRRDFSHASFICEREPESLKWESDTDSTYGWTGVYLRTDGRNNDIPDQFHVVPNEGLGDPYYTFYTISQQASLYPGFSGYTTSEVTTFTDGYHNNSLNSYFIEGSGYMAAFSGSSVSWSVSSNKNVAGAMIRAQALWDWVMTYPGAGDVWTGSAYNTPTPLGVHWAGRGRVQGIQFKENNTPFTGREVSSDPDVGSAVTDSHGHYMTSVSFPQQDQSVEWSADPASTHPVTVSHNDTGNQRICWREGSEQYGILDYCTTPWGRHVTLFRGVKNVKIGLTSNYPNPAHWELERVVSYETVDDGAIQYTSSGRIYVLLSWSGQVYRSYSDNEGRTWEEWDSIGMGKNITSRVTNDGIMYEYWTSSGTILGQISDAAGNIIKSTFTAIASGVDDDKISVDVYRVGSGSVRVRLWYTSSGTKTSKVSENGYSDWT